MRQKQFFHFESPVSSRERFSVEKLRWRINRFNKNMIELIKKHYLIIFFLLFYFCITSYKLISHPTPFYDWDESIYAQVGREMVRAKSIVPLWQGQYWLDKPPLTPLSYGIVESIVPLSPEISTRIFTLLLSIAVLGLTYIFYYRLSKDVIISLLTAVISSFTPIFLQRSQVLNVDVFLLLGWYGYLVFYKNFWLSLIFLFVGVLSKSMLGFYPLIGMLMIETIQLYFKRIKWKEYKEQVIKMIIQIAFVSIWFILMLIIFQYDFIKNQFLEAMLKRVTASIESHFGKRTFYIDILLEQLGVFIYPALASLIIVIYKFGRALVKKNHNLLFIIYYLLFFLPWFLFLNVTKTKIAWYLYPVIPQFAFLAAYVFYFIKKDFIKWLVGIGIVIFTVYQALYINNFFQTYYSGYDQYYELAKYVKNNCNDVTILVDSDTRKTYEVLHGMNLTISTTQWWGNHPSIVYYSDKKVYFLYDTKQFNNKFLGATNQQCFAITPTDLSNSAIMEYVVEKKFKDILVISKPF